MPTYYEVVVPGDKTIANDQDFYDFFSSEIKPAHASRWTKDDPTRTVRIHVPFAVMVEDTGIKTFITAFTGKRPGPDTEAAILEQCGTPFYKKQVANQEVLTSARDTLRTIVPQEPPNTSNVDMTQKPSDVMGDMLGGAGPGICLGRTHSEPESLTELGDVIDNTPAGLLFFEEFLTDEQADLDAYLDPANDDPDNFNFGMLPARLETLLSTNKVDWKPILKKAKVKGSKIYGIDSAEGREYAGPLTEAINSGNKAASDSMGERRVSGMNKVTFDVMTAALNNPANAGRKFVAVVGAKHSNTHEGGIPGVSQMFGCSAIRLDPNNKARLKLDPENRSLRGMPPLDEQLYVDYAMTAGARLDPKASGDALRRESLAQAKLLKANNLLPTADEQIFIQNYIEIARNSPALADKDAETLRAAALKVAKRKTANGELPTAHDMKGLVDAGTIATEVDAAEQLMTDIKAAINGNDAGEFRRLLQANTDAVTMKDREGNSILQLAVRSRQTALITEVCASWPVAALVDPPNKDGETALHLAVKGRPTNDPGKTAQANCVQALITGGADVNRGNRSGATALHMVGKTDNEKASEKLINAGADVTIRDDRGWTSLDAAIAGTSVNVEKDIYDKGKAAPTENYDNATTIERLMAATLCENPEDREAIQAAYEKLYMIPELQPLLKLAALAASNKRQPTEQDNAPRIVVARGDSVKNLYDQPPNQQSQYPQGAYDEGGGVVMLSRDSANDFAGVLMHELTHMATHVMYGDDVEPFDQHDDQAKQDYIDAIEKDVKTIHLLCPEDPIEAKVKERISGRMLKYAIDGRPNDKGLLQEFIVGVPQLIAEFGPDVVRKFAPNLYESFVGFSEKCETTANGNRFYDASDWIDDSSLHLEAPTFTEPRAPHKQVVEPTDPSLTIDGLMKTIKADYLAKHGNKQPTAGTIAFDESSFTLDPGPMRALDKKLAKVKSALEKALAPDRLTTPIALDEVRKLVQQAADLTHMTAEKDLETAVTNDAGGWLMSAKLDYISRKAFSGELMSDIELAEAIALNSEDQARTDGSSNFDYTVNLEKHAKFVAKLSTDIGRMPGTKKDDMAKQGIIIDAVVTNITGSKSAGIYHKTAGRFSVKTIDPKHVSINFKNARRQWLMQLNSL